MLDGSYVTVSEAAAELDLSTARVRQLIGSGQLRAEQVNARLWVIARSVLDEFKSIDRTPGLHVDKRPAQAKRKMPARSRRRRTKS